MLRIIQSTNAASAAHYYTEGLKREDYYSLGHEVEGRWHGLALEKLGLASGNTETAKQFTALLHNRHPLTDKKLTPRMNAGENRTPGWDFVFSLPKSCSLLLAVTGDEELKRAFRESVAETMAEIEKQVATRVRIGRRQEDRATGNFAWCEFLHTTTRPLEDGLPDPHFHIHAYVFNLTHDLVEDRFKAAKIREIKDNGFFYEALYDSILTQKLEKIGYPVERTAKGWELAWLNDPSLLKKFSRRTDEIEKLAKQLGITDPKEKDKLGAKTRNRKKNGLSESDLVEAWKSRMNGAEQAALDQAYRRQLRPPSAPRTTVGEALDFAEAKLFQRESVVDRNRILASALKFGVGSVTLADIEAEMKRRGFIEREIGGEPKVTTIPRVVEEALMIQRVRDGRGKLAPIHKGRLSFSRDFLSKEQREAVRHILKSHDQVIALRGKAGSGKTTLLSEVREQVEKSGRRLFAFAPSAQASRGVLRDEGFKGAETVARLLVDKQLQLATRGHVILIDEAGTIGIPDLARIMEIAGQSTRVILSGDTGQHAPVARGDSMRLLETYAGLPVATVRQIRRQESEGYRKAVEAMADKDLKTAFARLDEIGAITEVPDAEIRYQRLARDYAQCILETGIAPLLVSPTHAEARAAVKAIRVHLSEIGKLGPEQRFRQYRELKWEDAEKGRAENYEPGQMVQFHQNVAGIKRGAILPVLGVDPAKTVWAQAPNGKRVALDLAKADRFRVYEIGEVQFAPGDPLKITNGGRDLNGRRLENGKLSTVKGIGKDGRITLANGLVLSPDFGHVAHGYDTSHSSQGKTSREVFVAQSAMSFRAGSSEQFYVSISRGKERLRIYTDDRTGLQLAVGNSARRLSALEFTGLGEEIFMKGSLKGVEWTKRIAANREHRKQKFASHAQKVMADRNIDPKQAISSFVDYIEMRRANVSPDGKNRAKGHPDSRKSKGRGKKGIPDPRRNEKAEKQPEQPAELSKKPDPKEPEKKRTSPREDKPKKPEGKRANRGIKNSELQDTAKEMKASDKHLKEVVERTQRGRDAAKRGSQREIDFSKTKASVGKLSGNKKTREEQIKQQITQKPPSPKPPTPTPPIRRGR
ncbi:relaxase domain-containing protein [Luteolibacter ambystomatis]|uniref:Relaxase domain-containing protein n=1 Tax=Luteolibacter ambystomatis TaxID=2824561 RepID=A0A975J1G5_9BACT|nr:MobF family relaxase [Luteolibacter ambystomatis]QUE52280.1 relaxase domain-containing protein [Luteolibacter ambystomatis]